MQPKTSFNAKPSIGDPLAPTYSLKSVNNVHTILRSTSCFSELRSVDPKKIREGRASAGKHQQHGIVRADSTQADGLFTKEEAQMLTIMHNCGNANESHNKIDVAPTRLAKVQNRIIASAGKDVKCLECTIAQPTRHIPVMWGVQINGWVGG